LKFERVDSRTSLNTKARGGRGNWLDAFEGFIFFKTKKILESLGFEADTKFIDFTFHNKVQNLNEESTFETQESNLAQSMVLEKKEQIMWNSNQELVDKKIR
jgi:hypothetical protein